MKTKKVDYIILGGGCSALTFASELSKNNVKNLSFLIIEEKKKYEDDRSWCFWDNQNYKNKNLISRSWKAFSISCNRKKIIHCSEKYKYNYIRSKDFYNYACNVIKKTKNITLILGEEVLNIEEKQGSFLVKTNKSTYHAKKILDTRPKKNIYKVSPFLFQSFLGYEIVLNKNKYLTEIVGIMENMRFEKNNFIFDYILPLRKNCLLVEVTSFSKTSLSTKQLEILIEKTLKGNNINNFKIIRKEYGVIPMGYINKDLLNNGNNYFYAGSVGGAVRPSSGYAFLRIQKWAEEAVSLLNKKGEILSHPKEKIIIRYLDKLFLRVLEKNLSSAPFIFYIFLKRISTKSFIRFMIGNPNIVDYLKIILAMPKKYFLNANIWK